MQPVVMAPNNLSTRHYRLEDKHKGKRPEGNTGEHQKKDPRKHKHARLYNFST